MKKLLLLLIIPLLSFGQNQLDSIIVYGYKKEVGKESEKFPVYKIPFYSHRILMDESENWGVVEIDSLDRLCVNGEFFSGVTYNIYYDDYGGVADSIFYKYPSEQMVKEYKWKDGKLNGIGRWWYKYGFLAEEVTYKNGKKHGWYQSYDEHSGGTWCEGEFENGKHVGIWRCYYSNGNLADEETYVNGQKTKYLRYGKDGNLRHDMNWALEYDDNGELVDDINWDNRLLHGPFKKYFDNGNILIEGYYDNDKKVGIWKEYYKNEQLKFKEIYKYGKLLNKKCWDEDGNKTICE